MNNQHYRAPWSAAIDTTLEARLRLALRRHRERAKTDASLEDFPYDLLQELADIVRDVDDIERSRDLWRDVAFGDANSEDYARQELVFRGELAEVRIGGAITYIVVDDANREKIDALVNGDV